MFSDVDGFGREKHSSLKYIPLKVARLVTTRPTAIRSYEDFLFFILKKFVVILEHDSVVGEISRVTTRSETRPRSRLLTPGVASSLPVSPHSVSPHSSLPGSPHSSLTGSPHSVSPHSPCLSPTQPDTIVRYFATPRSPLSPRPQNPAGPASPAPTATSPMVQSAHTVLHPPNIALQPAENIHQQTFTTRNR